MSDSREMILIRGGTVIDGTGTPGRRADVLLRGDRIVAVGDPGPVTEARTIEATGKVVCPGFVDPHNHADSEVRGGIAAHPLADNLVRQGITTVICNQCGGGTYPIAPLLEAVDYIRPVTNVAMLAAHAQIRSHALQDVGAEKPTAATWERMRDYIRDEMEAGAYGVTTGPLGRTQAEMPTAELVEAGRAVAPYGGVYASHIRDEGETNGHLAAIEEVCTVCRETGAKGHVSHLKLWGHCNWGATEPVLEIFDRAERDGLTMAADQYPYIGGYRGFFSLLWDWADPAQPDAEWRRGAEAEVRRQLDLLGGPERLIISSHETDDPLDGRSIGAAGRLLGVPPEAVVTELYRREPRPSLSAFFLAMREEDLRTFMCSKHTMAGTDSHVRIPGSGASHPRNYGTYPRFLGKYVREEKIMPLARMISRMTARVAEQFGLRDRGRLVPGAYADVVVFDPATVRDRATWQNGYAYPVGIEWVLVNGGITVADGQGPERGYGRALRRGQ